MTKTSIELQLDATCRHPESNTCAYRTYKKLPVDTKKHHGSQAGGVRLEGNLTSDFLVADMSSSANAWDLDKGGDGKKRQKIVKIMTHLKLTHLPGHRRTDR